MESGVIVILKINFEFAIQLLCPEKSSIIPLPGPTDIGQGSLICFSQAFLPKLKISP